MSDWRDLRLGDALTITHGFAFRSEYFADQGSCIVLTPGNFQDAGGFKMKSGAEKYYKGPVPKGYVLSEGDVVVAMTEQAHGLLGSTATIPSGDTYLHNQRIGLVRVIDPGSLDLRFVYHLFNLRAVRIQLQATATGSKVRHTAPERIENVRVSVPNVVVQRRVAKILDAIDDLIENNRRRIALLERVAQAIYREWFVHFRYPGHEDDELIDSPLGPIPAGWETSDVGSETLNFDRLRKPLSRRERLERPGRFPYYGAARVIDSIDNYLFDGDYLLVAEDGSVVTEAGFPILQRVRGQFWVSNHAHVLQGAGRVTTTFLELALEEYPIMGHVTGAAQPKVTQENLNRIRLLVPAPNVITAFSDVVEAVVDEQFVLAARCAVLEQIRDALLPKLVTGAIDVSHLDLDALLEEPAA